MNALKIATRGSKLALWQAEYVRDRLRENEPSLEVGLVVLKTEGDRVLDRPLSQIGGKGLFTKEIEEALLDGRADIAVHSMKDLPAQVPDGLLLCASPPRADPADALLLAPRHRGLMLAIPPGGSGATELLSALPAGARIATSSVRRLCQLRRLRPDLEIVPLRGNVDTRLRKLDEGESDAIVLAAAGLMRLGFADRIDARFTTAEMLPACGQGALGLECRTDDSATQQRLKSLADAETMVAVAAERAFSLRLGGSCQTPLAAHAVLRSDDNGGITLHLDGMVGSLDGQTVLRQQHSGPRAEAVAIGQALAERLLAAGADTLIAQAAR